MTKANPEVRNIEVLFAVTKDALLIANGGRSFTRKGVISVCASYLSDKRASEHDVEDDFEATEDELVAAIRNSELYRYKGAGGRNRILSDSRAEEETSRDYGGRSLFGKLERQGIPYIGGIAFANIVLGMREGRFSAGSEDWGFANHALPEAAI